MIDQGTERARPRFKTARPDIVAADQPQPVDPLGVGEVCRAGRSGVHAAPARQHGSTCGRGEGGFALARPILHRLPHFAPVRKSDPNSQGRTPMISLAELQRRIDSGDLSADAALAQSVEAIDAQEKTIGAFVCRAENPRGKRRSAARHRRRDQGHHRYRGFSDRNGLEDLPGLAAARGCARRHAAEAGGGDHYRQDHDHGVCRQRSDGDAQSAQSRPYAGRIVVGLGGGRRRRHDSAGAGDADRRFGDPAGLVLRRRRDQADLSAAADRRREMLFVDARHRRAVRGRRQGSGPRAFGHDGPARIAAGCRDRDGRASAS